MLNNRKYNIRGILREVKRREKEERKFMNLINKLCINDLKKGEIVGAIVGDKYTK